MTGTIPIYIINRNRYSTTKELVDYFRDVSGCKVIIVDNQSTYQPLLDWYRSHPCEIIRLSTNIGHHSPWIMNLMYEYRKTNDVKWYVVTDSDINLNGVPKDVLNYLIKIQCRYPGHQKVGLGLRINDLPLDAIKRQYTIDWEKQFWQNKIDNQELYVAGIDTTFALYDMDHPNPRGTNDAIRTGEPYVARHIPWYITPKTITKEEIYYANNVSDVSHWGNVIKQQLQISKRIPFI